MKFKLVILIVCVLSSSCLTNTDRPNRPEENDSSIDVSSKSDVGGKIDVTIPATCQNGTLDLDEFCEGLETRDSTCLTEGFSGGKIGCTQECTIDTSKCYKCGDGEINPGEVCDEDNFGGKSCDSELGAAANGALSCGETCTAIDIQNCVTKYVQVAAGKETACGLKSDGTVQCWGKESLAPIPDGPYTQITVGSSFACGLKIDGTIECWGSPVEDIPTGTFQQITYGDGGFLCALGTNRRIKCWGNADNVVNTPTSATFTAVSAGRAFSCGLTEAGKLECWGGDVPIVPTDTFTSLSVKGISACGIRENESIRCWGQNIDTTPIHKTKNLSVGGRSGKNPQNGNFIALDEFACGIKTDGEVFCWGDNENGESTAPSGMFDQVSAGPDFVCGLKAQGTIECWGDDSDGKLDVPE